MIENMPSLISTLGFPIVVVCYLLYERSRTMHCFEKAIKVDLVKAINDLKVEIVKLNERCKGEVK